MTKILKSSFENNQELLKCPECNNSIISDSYTGDTICESCGLVISEKQFDISNFGKNMYTSEEIRERSRSGYVKPLLTPKPYYNTIIKKYEIKNKDFYRQALLDFSNNNSEVRNLVVALRHLKRICSILKIPNHVKAHTILLYRKAFKKGIIRGRSIIGVLIACLYASCRIFKLPISFNELSKQTDKKEKKFYGYYLSIVRELKLKILPLGPEDFFPKIITNLNLSFEIEKKARMLLPYLKPFSIGKDPKVISASLIYFICKKSKIYRTQKEVTKIAGITETSLRNICKQIENYFLKNKISFEQFSEK